MEETQFGLEFVITRNGQPISEVIEVHGAPIVLHEKHDPATVWKHQAKVLATMVQAEILINVDGLNGVVRDTRPVGLAPHKPLFIPTRKPIAEYLAVPILKQFNRFLSWLVRRLNGLQ